MDISAGSYYRSSSNFDSFGSSATAATGLISTLNFTYEEIFKATQKFSQENILGEGGFGSVYKGRLANGTLVAVKRAKKVTSHCITKDLYFVCHFILCIRNKTELKLIHL